MKRLYRLLLAWLLMLALPLQGYAGTHMLMCPASAAPGAQAQHAAMQAQPGTPPCHGHAVQAEAHPDTHHDSHAGHDAKPGSCAACYLLAAMAIAVRIPLVLDGPVSTAIPFHDRQPPSVHLALPDRPPRFAAA